MNKKHIITTLAITFLITNTLALKAFSFNALGDYLYNKPDYKNAISKFEIAGNKQGIYNKANSLYKQKKYEESIKEYMSLLSNDESIIDFRLGHNIGNNYYRLGEQKNDSEQKIKYWEKSIEYYRKALDIKYDEETKQNLEYVLKKLEEEKKKQQNQEPQDKQEQNKQDENKSGSGSQDNSGESNESKSGSGSQEKQDGDKSGDNSDDKKGQSGEQSSEQKGGQEKQAGEGKEQSEKQEGQSINGEKSDDQSGKDAKNGETKSPSEKTGNNLSTEQSQALQQYQEALKQEQKNNSDSFNKVYQPNSDSNDPFDIFRNDPFFNNDLLNGTSGEKDW